MSQIRIAINGFGRIGRAAFRIALDRPDQIEVVAINDPSSIEQSVYLLKYDSAYGIFNKEVKAGEDFIEVDGEKFKRCAEKEIEKLPWKELDVDVVLECTGAFRKKKDAEKHITAGAKNVIISAPAKGDDPVGTYVMGVNQNDLDATKEKIISNASCTTNCIAPVIGIMHKKFKVLKSFMTTIHAYTSSQAVVDGGAKAKDMRTLRAAAVNIIPTSTGAAKATALTIPSLKGKFDGIAMRVPVITGSISDITMLIEKKTTVEEINETFKKAAQEPMYKGVIQASEEPIVSSDIIGNTHSAIVDLPLTRVIDGDLVKVVAWYDNEWGYTQRLIDQALEVAKDIKK